MADDVRDLLEVLRLELQFIEHGGYYGRFLYGPRKASIFQDSPTCLNFADLERVHPCSECVLFDLVPQDKRTERVPCHHIPLDPAGRTIANLQPTHSHAEIEQKVRFWLRESIDALEDVRKRA